MLLNSNAKRIQTRFLVLKVHSPTALEKNCENIQNNTLKSILQRSSVIEIYDQGRFLGIDVREY